MFGHPNVTEIVPQIKLLVCQATQEVIPQSATWAMTKSLTTSISINIIRDKTR